MTIPSDRELTLINERNQIKNRATHLLEISKMCSWKPTNIPWGEEQGQIGLWKGQEKEYESITDTLKKMQEEHMDVYYKTIRELVNNKLKQLEWLTDNLEWPIGSRYDICGDKCNYFTNKDYLPTDTVFMEDEERLDCDCLPFELLEFMSDYKWDPNSSDRRNLMIHDFQSIAKLYRNGHLTYPDEYRTIFKRLMEKYSLEIAVELTNIYSLKD